MGTYKETDTIYTNLLFKHDDLILIFTWDDDGETYGPVLGKGKIGFRQMTPLIAEYSDKVVKKVVPAYRNGSTLQV